MFPGPIATAFQKLQGSSQSSANLTRCIWLFCCGRNCLNTWKDAMSAVCDICHKVILPQSLQLPLELADFPRNEWEKIIDLWSTSSEPLLSISPGIRFNPDIFAGLDKHDIETADFIGMWTQREPQANFSGLWAAKRASGRSDNLILSSLEKQRGHQFMFILGSWSGVLSWTSYDTDRLGNHRSVRYVCSDGIYYNDE